MKRARPADPELRAALDRIVANTLGPVAAGLAVAYAALGVARLGMPYHPGHWVHLPVAVASALILLVVFAALRRRALPPGRGHPAAAGLAGFVLANSVVDLVVEKPDETVLFILLAVGAGALLLSWRWLGLVLVATAAGWLAVAAIRWESDPGEWLEFGAFLAIGLVTSVVVHATRLRSVEGLERARRRFQVLVEFAPDAIVIVDEEGSVVDVNHQAESLFGYERGELAGRSVEVLLPQRLREIHAAQRAGYSTAPRTRSMGSGLELSAVRKNGEEFPVEIALSTIPEDDASRVIAIVRDLSERKRAEAALLETNERLGALVRASPLAISAIDAQGLVTMWNRAAERIFGWTEEEALGRILPWVPEDSMEEFRALLGRVLSGETMTGVELRRQRKDGSPVDVSLSAAPLHDASGEIVGVIGVVEDVTERRAAARLAERLGAQLAGAQALAGVGSFDVDVVGDTAVWSEEMRRIFWLEEDVEDIPFQVALDRAHPDDRELVARSAENAIRRGEPARFEHRLLGPGGQERTVAVSLQPEVDDAGRTVRLLGTIQEVTERIRKEHEIRLLQTVTRAVAEAPDLDGALESALRMVCEATGWTVGEAWVPDAAGTVLSPSPSWYAGRPGLEGFREASERFTFARGVGLPGRVWESGRAAWIPDVTADPNFPRARWALEAGLRAAAGVPVLGDDEVVAVLAFYLPEAGEEDIEFVELVSAVAAQLGNVVRRKRAEEALREAETKFRTLVEQVPGMFYVDSLVEDQPELYVSPHSEHLFGVSPEEYVADGRWWEHHLHPDDRERLMATYRGVIESGVAAGTLEYRVVRPDGRVVWIQDISRTVHDAGGRPLFLQGVMLDITEQKQAELLREGQRRVLEAIASGTSLGGTLETLVRLAEDQADDVRAAVLLVEGDALSVGAAPSLPQEYVRAIDGARVQDGVACAAAVIRREPVIVTDVASDPAWEKARDMAVRHGIRACASIPVVGSDGTVLGVVASYLREARGPRIAELEVLESVASLAAIAIQRDRDEQALRESLERFRTLASHAPVGIFQLDARGLLEWVNERWCEIAGIDPDEGLGRGWERAVHPEDRNRVVAELERAIAAEGEFGSDYRYVLPDGTVRWVTDEGVPLRGRDGALLGWIGTEADITARKATEEVLRRSEGELRSSLEVLREADEARRRMLASLVEAQEQQRERMAEGIEDEQLQQLTALGVRLETLRRAISDPEQVGAIERLGDTVKDAMGRMRGLLAELRPRELETSGLGAAISRFLEANPPGEGVETLVEDGVVHEPSDEIRTVAFRLVQDAIRRAAEDPTVRRLEVHLRNRDGGVLIRVVDDGAGFATGDPAAPEPGAITMMRQLAELSGGSLVVRSAPGSGAAIELWLPAERPSQPEESSQPGESSPPGEDAPGL